MTAGQKALRWQKESWLLTSADPETKMAKKGMTLKNLIFPVLRTNLQDLRKVTQILCGCKAAQPRHLEDLTGTTHSDDRSMYSPGTV